MSDGVCTYGAVTDNWPTIEPYFNETGSNCPSILPVATQKELLDLAVASVQALGFRLGVFHVELKATSRGPRLIEVNARMGGGGVRCVERGKEKIEQGPNSNPPPAFQTRNTKRT
jgi:carnosine synthase